MTAVTIANTFGALEIGSWFAVFLFGIVTLQGYIYFERYPDDRLLFKALVSSLSSFHYLIKVMTVLALNRSLAFGIE